MAVLGERFARALADKDHAALKEVLAEDVDFKGLTPGRFWEATGADQVLDVLFGHWIEDHDHIDRLESVDVGEPVEDTQHVAYRLAMTLREGPHVVEQQAYFREADGRIGYLRVLCSGYRARAN
jgi:hypothetical protein